MVLCSSHLNAVPAGECGLDFNRNFSPPEVQEQWFGAQVQLAQQLQKPLFMHCRDAGEVVSKETAGSWLWVVKMTSSGVSACCI
jgi:Tat protein secretion system quality control protein TatD with DNase activity